MPTGFANKLRALYSLPIQLTGAPARCTLTLPSHVLHPPPRPSLTLHTHSSHHSEHRNHPGPSPVLLERMHVFITSSKTSTVQKLRQHGWSAKNSKRTKTDIHCKGRYTPWSKCSQTGRTTGPTCINTKGSGNATRCILHNQGRVLQQRRLSWKDC